MVMFIVKELYWLFSDDINNDMRMVCLMVLDDVDYVDVGWFSYKVFFFISF